MRLVKKKKKEKKTQCCRTVDVGVAVNVCDVVGVENKQNEQNKQIKATTSSLTTTKAAISTHTHTH